MKKKETNTIGCCIQDERLDWEEDAANDGSTTSAGLYNLFF